MNWSMIQKKLRKLEERLLIQGTELHYLLRRNNKIYKEDQILIQVIDCLLKRKPKDVQIGILDIELLLRL